MARKLSILIPAYNERYTIDQVVEMVLQAPLPDGMDREVIIVDDCSTDGTRDVLQTIAEREEKVSLFFHDVNQGKGAAMRTAIGKASGDIMVFQDADLEYDPNEYERMLEPILSGDADVVYGSRFLPRDYKRVLFFWHSLGNRCLTTLSNLFTNLDLTDMETCYKMSRAHILKSMPIRSNRFGMEPELTAKFSKRGCRIYETPISYRGRTYQEGKKITWWDGVKAMFTIVYFWCVDDLYNEEYGHEILHSLSLTHRFNRWMADAIKPWVGEDVLEIGAGMGNLTLQLLPRLHYCATDVDPMYLDYLKNRFADNDRVTVAKVDMQEPADYESLRERFDTVVALNVIEHVENDDQALQNAFSALRPGGRMCILVPRGKDLSGSFDEVLGHYRRYEGDDLKEKLEKAGFVVEKTFTFNKMVVPGWYLHGKVLKRKTFSKIQLKLFDSTVWLWKRIDRVLPWRGLSLIAVARKPE